MRRGTVPNFADRSRELQVASILLIDDDAGIRSTARLILETAGHTVSEAADGEQGLAIFDTGDFDLVITDLYMPGKEGIETIQDLADRGSRVPILAVSGMAAAEGGTLQDAYLLGADATLAKPFSAADLRQAVADLLIDG